MRLPRLRLTVRVMMALVAALGLVLAVWITRARAQRDAVAALGRMGGVVLYDFEFRGVESPKGPGRRPGRLGRWLGVDFAHDVTKVTFFGRPIPPEADPLLRRLPRLEALARRNSPLAEGELGRICGIATIRELDLSFTDLGDEGIGQLARLEGLRRLRLGGTRITDGGVAALAACRRLEDLDLFGARLTREGIGRLAGITGLRRVRLKQIDTEEVVAGLPPLASLEALELDLGMFFDPGDEEGKLMGCLRGLPRLRELKVSGSFRDARLEEVAELKGLEVLDVEQSLVTDAGLRRAADLPRLRRLVASFTRVTPAGVAAFRAARPDVEVEYK